MPRPDKQMNDRGPLDGPVSASRPVVWKKRAGPESIEVSDEFSAAIGITVDDLTVTTEPTMPHEEISKWTARATSAQLPIANEVANEVADDEVVGSGVRLEPQPARTEWVVTRSIEGRTYRRTDVLTTIQEHPGG
ncbi:MAG: hypothetical protein R6W79_05345 [Acidimicrobiia bacterium]